MAHRINIQYTIEDTRGQVKKNYLQNLGLRGAIKNVSIVDSYTIDTKLTKAQLQKVAAMLANPLIEQASIDSPLSPKKFDWAIEIGFLPGVTDNAGNTARQAIEDLLKIKFKKGEGVYSSQVFFLSGKLLTYEVNRVAESLYNPLIQRAKIKSFEQFKRDGGFGAEVPRVVLPKHDPVTLIDLEISDPDLEKLGALGIPNKDGSRRGPLALDLPSLRAIRNHFRRLGRKPTDVEIESIAQTWSEHCKHVIFNSPMDGAPEGIFKKYIRRATEDLIKKGKKDFAVSVFKDNAGAINFDDKHLVSYKVETHNTPSALDPYGGALTGIGGVNRDILGFGLGSKPVINTYGFCVGNPEDKTELYRDKERKQKMLSPKRILQGVVAGVNTGGNNSGIPTPQGFVFFDHSYTGKPLVFAGTVGLIPKKVAGKPSHVKKSKPGDLIVMMGGRVGQDGIHGATFSSEELDPNSPATAVQIGDPITQKKLSDAIIRETRDLGLYSSITDNGAGGLSSSVGEMAKDSGGCEVYLDKVPLKYPGLEPWKIWISESQERMTLAVPPAKWKKFKEIMDLREVEATVIGKFTNSGRCKVLFGKQTVMDLDLEFLHEGLPIKKLKIHPVRSRPDEVAASAGVKKDYSKTILEMLSLPNIASYEFISTQYDHEVQAGSVVKPLQGPGRINGGASITRPVLESKKGVVLAQGLYPRYSKISAYDMAAASIDTAIRNAVAAGANLEKIAILDNFCWASSDDPKMLGLLKQAAQACYDYATIYGTPFISGKDSMFNDFFGFDKNGKRVKISALPTLLISSIGIIDDVTRAQTIYAKFPRDIIYLLGETNEELGGSEYYEFLGAAGNSVPKVDAKLNKKLYAKLEKAIKTGVVNAACSLTRGGLSVSLAKMMAAGKLGAHIRLDSLPGNWKSLDGALFSESQGRILATVSPKDSAEFEKLMSGVSFSRLGEVTREQIIEISEGRKTIANLKVEAVLKAYKSTFKNY